MQSETITYTQDEFTITTKHQKVGAIKTKNKKSERKQDT